MHCSEVLMIMDASYKKYNGRAYLRLEDGMDLSSLAPPSKPGERQSPLPSCALAVCVRAHLETSLQAVCLPACCPNRFYIQADILPLQAHAAWVAFLQQSMLPVLGNPFRAMLGVCQESLLRCSSL